MSLPRFFLEDQVLARETEKGFALRLPEGDLRHLNVLRLRVGEHIAVIDAEGDYFECEITDASEIVPKVRITSRENVPIPPCSVTLFQGIPKSDKMDEIVRHATEVGVDAFVPVAFKRCVSRLDDKKARKKRERWMSVARSAAMQAGRMSIPEVESPLRVNDMRDALCAFDCIVVFWEEADSVGTLKDLSNLPIPEGRPLRVAVVVGPEGGIAPEEVEVIHKASPPCIVASLGPSILRTETAGVVGCAIVIYESGGLGNARRV